MEANGTLHLAIVNGICSHLVDWKVQRKIDLDLEMGFKGGIWMITIFFIAKVKH